MANAVDAATATMIANYEKNTGKPFEDWVRIAGREKLAKHGEIVKFLKQAHGMGHGYANLVAQRVLAGAAPAPAGEDLVAAQFAGAKAALRPAYDKLAKAVSAFGADVEFSPTRLLEPDVFAIRDVRGRPPMSYREAGQLLLVAEVLSPTTARHDRLTKRRIYMEEGVGEYWIVDADARTIERWRPGQDRPEMIDGVLRWEPAPNVPPLDLDVGAMFEEALGE